MSATKKIIVTSIIGLLLAAAGIGYYLYNKPAVDVQNADSQKVVAATLYQTFTHDSTSAKKNYTSKILEVSGTVSKVSVNQQKQPVVYLTTGTDGAAVNCTLEGPANQVAPGQAIIVKGICNGIGEGDADLGIMGDVYLIRCYVVK